MKMSSDCPESRKTKEMKISNFNYVLGIQKELLLGCLSYGISLLAIINGTNGK